MDIVWSDFHSHLATLRHRHHIGMYTKVCAEFAAWASTEPLSFVCPLHSWYTKHPTVLIKPEGKKEGEGAGHFYDVASFELKMAVWALRGNTSYTRRAHTNTLTNCCTQRPRGRKPGVESMSTSLEQVFTARSQMSQ